MLFRSYAPNIGAPQYIRQILTAIKGEIDSKTIILRDVNLSLSKMDRSSRQKVIKEIFNLNYAPEQMDLTDIYRTFHQTSVDIHSSQVHTYILQDK